MSIERAEQLKCELTDKWVVVAPNLPELRRFSALTGKVKTVNMNCRALVEFDGPEDISWYDIDPQFLTVVDGPRPKAKVEEKAKPAAKKATNKNNCIFIVAEPPDPPKRYTSSRGAVASPKVFLWTSILSIMLRNRRDIWRSGLPR